MRRGDHLRGTSTQRRSSKSDEDNDIPKIQRRDEGKCGKLFWIFSVLGF